MPLAGLLDVVGIESVVAEVPGSARDVLDLSCGDGRLGAALKERARASGRPCRVVGVEPDRRLAAEASERLDEVVRADPERVALPFLPKSFDAVLAIGALERAADPWKLAWTAARWLRSRGRLVAAASEDADFGRLAAAQVGHWNYRDSGVFDAEHVREMEADTLSDVVRRAGLDLVPSACGHLVVGERPPVPAPDRGVSAGALVVATRNSAGNVARLLQGTANIPQGAMFQVIVVDNASTDTTAGLKGSDDGTIVVLHNPEDIGTVRALAQGARSARSRFLVFLDDRVAIGAGFLRSVADIFDSDRSIGAVVPLVLGPTGSVASAGLEIAGSTVSNPHAGARMTDPVVASARDVGALDLGACVVRRTAYEMVRGLDVDLDVLEAGADLARRLVEAEWRLVYRPEVRIVRYPGPDGGP